MVVPSDIQTAAWLRVLKRIARANDGCWLWTGPLRRDGYGEVRVGEKVDTVHRVAYRARFGVIPPGHILHHTCRNPACVNPEHLQPMTRRDHTRLHSAEQTHCINGHEFTPENTRIDISFRFPVRRCRICEYAKTKRYVQKKKAIA